ncbi:truncated Tnp (plasmid) [Allorhizobium ampelinum S4]|uniref:Truncated Tnp n=1 Tax=Allorhizobium ampelinum (strain ATCC BAA-846 / DSM 112012 / S4) TaxID=311402 RepID=B9K4Z8_ALLAM|nr:truncated Tnp [Allorhizobium ampelinum S4]
MKVRNSRAYLYRAVDKLRNTIDFYLSPTRTAKTANRFLGNDLVLALPDHG